MAPSFTADTVSGTLWNNEQTTQNNFVFIVAKNGSGCEPLGAVTQKQTDIDDKIISRNE